MASARNWRIAMALAGFTFLSACEQGQNFNLFGANQPGVGSESTAPRGASVVVEQDVEAPEVFQETDSGLWDGRPSLGGVWIAHPDVVDPERVMIRNEDNGKFTIGALFRRERENPGPRFQVSSDAATALGMLAGAPNSLSVVALRRVEMPAEPELPVVVDVPEAVDLAEVEVAPVETIGDPVTIEAAPLDPVAVIAASAIEAATASRPAASLPEASTATAAAPAPPPTSATPAPVSSAPLSAIAKPFVQIGIFSLEANANDTSDLLRSSGIIPTIKVSESNGKTYWRVLVGPLGNKADQKAVISKVNGLGFADAYAVSN